MEILEKFQHYISAEKLYYLQIEKINKNAEKIFERLKHLKTALNKTLLTVSKKEGRQDIIFFMQEQTQDKLNRIKKIKSMLTNNFFFILKPCIYFKTFDSLVQS